MSSLHYIDQQKFESLFKMKTGYVLKLSNNEFRSLIADTVSIDIYDDMYKDQGSSKANRLRSFWKLADDKDVAKVNRELLDVWLKTSSSEAPDCMKLYQECLQINNRLMGQQPVRNIDTLDSDDLDESLEKIVQDIKRNIESNMPELALDRLHNYLMSYGKKLCADHGIKTKDKETLRSLFGKYNKWLHENNILESEMSSKIIGSALKLFEEFNDVRNNLSAAHVNPLLNKYESYYVLDFICSSIRFIKQIEDIFAS